MCCDLNEIVEIGSNDQSNNNNQSNYPNSKFDGFSDYNTNTTNSDNNNVSSLSNFRSNSPDIQVIGSSMPQLNNIDDIVCITDQKPPSPVRRSYPHFDDTYEPLEKCPVCYMDFKRSEIERHTELCCEKTFSKARDTRLVEN